jgi:sulfopyruvate decarboxylase subunit beta
MAACMSAPASTPVGQGPSARTPAFSKSAAIRAVITASAQAPIVFTTGYTCRIARAIADQPSHLYMVGSMGLAAPIATGIAYVTGRPVVVVDGDGSLLMNPAALVTAGSMAPVPLVHVLLDDGRYASTGGQPTGAERVDLCGFALACGYRTSATAESVLAATTFIRRHLDTRLGPVFLRCPVSQSDEPVPGRIDPDLSELARRFSNHLRQREAGRKRDRS